jgi:hypothetical protein
VSFVASERTEMNKNKYKDKRDITIC